jgi:hypothetical protein
MECRRSTRTERALSAPAQRRKNRPYFGESFHNSFRRLSMLGKQLALRDLCLALSCACPPIIPSSSRDLSRERSPRFGRVGPEDTATPNVGDDRDANTRYYSCCFRESKTGWAGVMDRQVHAGFASDVLRCGCNLHFGVSGEADRALSVSVSSAPPVGGERKRTRCTPCAASVQSRPSRRVLTSSGRRPFPVGRETETPPAGSGGGREREELLTSLAA